MIVVFSIYFTLGAFIADRFNQHYRKRWGAPIGALHWFDIVAAWPAYLVGWHLLGR